MHSNNKKIHNLLIRVLKHTIKIVIHKKWVFYYSAKAGISIQGLFHDMSKFSPVEFFESVKYYQGNRSPIVACKEENGFSMAWFHHRGRNPHHYEMWIDDFDHGGKAIEMPYKYAVEMLCDYLGAARAYMGNDFSFVREYEWWKRKISNGIMIHKNTMKFIDSVLYGLYKNGESFLTKDNLQKLYIMSKL